MSTVMVERGFNTKISKDIRECVVECMMNDVLSHKEVSKLLGIKITTVTSIVHTFQVQNHLHMKTQSGHKQFLLTKEKNKKMH